MTDLVSARPAVGQDLPRIAEILATAQDGVRNERGGRWLLDHDRLAITTPKDRHAHAVTAADGALIVGSIEQTVVGYALAELSRTRSGTLCVVDELIVEPEARAIGVGSAILEAVIDWAVTNNCQAIESNVLPGNRAAKNFFERVGMKTRKMRVSRDLTS